MSFYVFVDNSNVWIEGKYASAVSKGWSNNIAQAHHDKILDNAWKFDFGKLLSCVSNEKLSEISEAVIIGSRPTENDSLWKAMESAGFKVDNPSRNASNKEKGVDTGLVVRISKALYRDSKEGDTFILVLGDKDYLPSVNEIIECNRKVKLVFWSNASGELIASSSEYLILDPILSTITY
jgi:Protein of unknown function DUF88.